MSAESAKTFLRAKGLEERILVMSQSTATVSEAAAAIGVSPDEIAKTLSFLVDGTPILIVTCGTARIDNPKYKQTFGTKAKMIAPEEVETLTGHAPGGVCPFGAKEGVKVYLDHSLRRFDYVYPAAGSDHTAVRLSIEELEQAVQPAGWVDVVKDPQ